MVDSLDASIGLLVWGLLLCSVDTVDAGDPVDSVVDPLDSSRERARFCGLIVKVSVCKA